MLVGAGGLVVWQVTKDDKPQTTREQFRAAAAAMGAAEAVRLVGAPIGGASTDLTVLKGGQATGTVSLGGLKIDVLRIDERTYVNRPTVTARGSTHIATTFMGLTSSGGVAVLCKLSPLPALVDCFPAR
ncbi:hypothetical protein O7614_17265 [Micromonospora sp. WMMD961]|uniref:hypothetical protein n=1 Tax=Micromonospora sp. WMMD961 TaxID=3016100 RepID=UPI002416D61D|nr:hypothetical protein [Micromonospora sp. WMMD961]MDG4781403.1 hypothetical protein [Micromonospora sp. WMMD961]